ncbi:MAG: pyruvate kinase [Gemmatimonadetes bacterium]|nr:pyruvate kinase [Gemmatimonadota bacterium]
MLRTKIVCTMGPASSSPEMIRALVAAGLDMARINMSHGSHETHARTIEWVREAAREAGRPVAVLADLAGPKIRVGDLPLQIELVPGAHVVLAPQAIARENEIPTTYPELAHDLVPGSHVLLDDGLLDLEVEAVEGDRAILTVVRGGMLLPRKGINLPGVSVRTASMTPKDEVDLEFALEHGAEYVGLSFVQRPEDVVLAKERVQGRALVIAKIEKARALDAIEEILAEADGVMVARGDLGVELPFEQVPLAQKRIIQLANFSGRPVITATQMLESMIEHPRPTRAEASDAANAVLDGTDALMLSGETAMGRYPVQAVEALVRVAREIERSGVLQRGPRYLTALGNDARVGASPREHAVASATVDAARQLGSPAILVITRSGKAARLVSSYRPPIPVFAICNDPITFQRLAPVWGVHPKLWEPSAWEQEEVTYELLTAFGRESVLEAGYGKPGDYVVVTAGVPFHTAGSTNTMRIEQL